jgi:hypothetical protein
MNPTELLGAASVPAILGLVEALKTAGLPARWAPLAAVALGILASAATFLELQWPLLHALLAGAGIGLAASGLYSGFAKPFYGPSTLTKATPPPATTALLIPDPAQRAPAWQTNRADDIPETPHATHDR